MTQTTTATVVFTDLVNSTELRRELGEERADRLRRDHDDALTVVVDACGGEVVKGGGDGLLCLFPSASDAVSAAVGMQQAIVGLRRRSRRDLRIRIGLSVGDVSLEGGDCFGMPVVEAARLEAAAAPGQILCSAFVRAMAGGRGGHRYVPVEPLELKGLAEPTEAYEVCWERTAPTTAPTGATPFVGREVELDQLSGHWEAAVTGHGGTVMIVADAGMGKSRLISEFLAAVGDQGFILAGDCPDGGTAPYAPIADALVRWAETDPAAALELLGPQAPVMVTMAPLLADVLPEVDAPRPVAPELVDKRLLDSWERVLRRCAGVSPTLLVVDDLHWADQGTLALLRGAVRVAHDAPLLVVLAYRDAEIIAPRGLAAAVAALVREGEPVPLELGGLDVDDVRSLLVQLGDASEVDDRFVELLGAESGGNPLFIRETLLHLLAEGRLRQEDDRWVGDDVERLELPDVLRHIIGRRLDRLSEGTRDLLSVAALFDAGFPLQATSEVASVDEEGSLNAVDEALAARIIEPTDTFDTYRFSHALFRHTLVDQLSPSRQSRLHRRVAETLVKQLSGAPTASQAAVIAQHFVASAEIPGAEAGVSYATAHGDAATEAASYSDALSAYRAARTLLAAGDERAADLQRSIALTATLARVDPEEILSEARRVVAEDRDRATTAAFLVELGRLRESEDVRTSWRLGDLARPLHSGERDDTWVSLRSWELSEREWQDPTAIGLPALTPERQELLEVATRLRSPALGFGTFIWESREAALDATEWVTPLQRGLIFAFHVGMYRESVESLSLALDEALDAGDTGTALFAASVLGRVRFVLGDFSEADRLVELGGDLVSRLDNFSNSALQYAGFMAMTRAARSSDWARHGASNVGDLFASLSPDMSWYQAVGEVIRVSERGAAGDSHGAVAVMTSLLDATDVASPGTPNLPLILELVAELCDIYNLQPDSRLARQITEKVLEPGFGYVETDAALALGIVAGLEREPDQAADWFDQGRIRLDACGNVTMRAWLAWCEARMEYRNEFAHGAARFDELIDEAQTLYEAMPGFESRVAQVAALAAASAGGEPLPEG